MTDLCACLQLDKIISEVVFLPLLGGLLILARFIYRFSGYTEIYRELSKAKNNWKSDKS